MADANGQSNGPGGHGSPVSDQSAAPPASRSEKPPEWRRISSGATRLWTLAHTIVLSSFLVSAGISFWNAEPGYWVDYAFVLLDAAILVLIWLRFTLLPIVSISSTRVRFKTWFFSLEGSRDELKTRTLYTWPARCWVVSVRGRPSFPFVLLQIGSEADLARLRDPSDPLEDWWRS